MEWSDAAPTAVSRYKATCAALPDGRLIVCGGISGDDGAVASTEIYDHASGTWSAGPTMESPRALACSAVLADGRMIVIGGDTGWGWGGETFLASTEILDPVADTWAAGPPLPHALAYAAAAALRDGRVMVLGGRTRFHPTDSTWVLLPGARQWTAGPKLCEPRHSASASLLACGRVIAIAGEQADTFCELFDPATNAWSAGPDPADTCPLLPAGTLAPFEHASATLPDGRVIVFGGDSDGACWFTTSAVLDLDAATWSLGPRLPNGRHGHSAVSLQDGRIMALGGVRHPHVDATDATNATSPGADAFDDRVTSILSLPHPVWWTIDAHAVQPWRVRLAVHAAMLAAHRARHHHAPNGTRNAVADTPTEIWLLIFRHLRAADFV